MLRYDDAAVLARFAGESWGRPWVEVKGEDDSKIASGLRFMRGEEVKGVALFLSLDLPKIGAKASTSVFRGIFCVDLGVKDDRDDCIFRVDGPASEQPLSRWSFIRYSGTSLEQIGLKYTWRSASYHIIVTEVSLTKILDRSDHINCLSLVGITVAQQIESNLQLISLPCY